MKTLLIILLGAFCFIKSPPAGAAKPEVAGPSETGIVMLLGAHAI